ncbi:hypothetical protein MK430_10065, partial [Streptococcus oralis]|nr:hypothetical protein [Streptococcus oralis]
QMDSVTQQHAARVDQVSAAAAALERQTEELQRAVHQLRLSADEQKIPAAPLVTPAPRHAAATKSAATDEWVAF